MSVQFGPLRIPNPLFLAPMAGITDSPFRALMRRHGCGVVISEMVSANGLEYSGEKSFELLQFRDEERPIGLQLFGERPELLAKASQIVEKLGAEFVDLNCGCPVPKVAKKGAGAALARDVPALYKIMTAMVKAVKIPVAIKIRLGWDQESKNAHEIVKAASDAGVAWVAVHGRTRAQLYSGKADWDAIGEVKSRAKLPIIGNGDITTAELAVERMKTYGVDGIMIGRGILKNPFLFEQTLALLEGRDGPPRTAENYTRMILEYRTILESAYSPHDAMIHARKFVSWFATGFIGCRDFRAKAFAIQEPHELWAETERFFRNTRMHDAELLTT